MKLLTTLVLCLFYISSYSQYSFDSDYHRNEDKWNLIISTDTKILLFGTDNLYTEHSGLGNFMITLEGIDIRYKGWQSVVQINYEYANLSRKYNHLYIGYGTKLHISDKLFIIPTLEYGGIWRERTKLQKESNYGIGVSLAISTSVDFRYAISKRLGLSFKFNAEQASDLPGRLIRWQTTQGLVYTF